MEGVCMGNKSKTTNKQMSFLGIKKDQASNY